MLQLCGCAIFWFNFLIVFTFIHTNYTIHKFFKCFYSYIPFIQNVGVFVHIFLSQICTSKYLNAPENPHLYSPCPALLDHLLPALSNG